MARACLPFYHRWAHPDGSGLWSAPVLRFLLGRVLR